MKEEPEENESTLMKVFLIVLFFAIISGMVYAGIAFRTPKTQSNNAIKYNNFEFYQTDIGWGVDWQNSDQIYKLQFRNLPSEVETVPMVGKLNDDFFKGYLYITFDPKEDGLQNLTLATGELSLNLARGLDYNLIASCTSSNNSACADRPVVSCKNTSQPIIYLVEKSPTLVNLSGNCITLQGEGKDLIKSVDKLLYVWYRIIKTEETNN